MMKLGIISAYDDQSLKRVADFGLSHVEFCINSDHEKLIKAIPQVQDAMKNHGLTLSSLGRWGTERITKDGINQAELGIDLALIKAAHALGSKIYVAGCNQVEALDTKENIKLAIEYLSILKRLTDELVMTLLIYNCRWGNFIIGPDEWDIMTNALPGIGIKYDPSHAIRDQQDYLKELLEYGHHIHHIHLKGSLIVDQKVVDDPPAGLDSTDWKSFMAILYLIGYQKTLSLEPHSNTWKDTLGDAGIRFSIRYFKDMILEDGK